MSNMLRNGTGDKKCLTAIDRIDAISHHIESVTTESLRIRRLLNDIKCDIKDLPSNEAFNSVMRRIVEFEGSEVSQR